MDFKKVSVRVAAPDACSHAWDARCVNEGVADILLEAIDYRVLYANANLSLDDKRTR